MSFHAAILGAYLTGGYVGLLIGLGIALALAQWRSDSPFIADEPDDDWQPGEDWNPGGWRPQYVGEQPTERIEHLNIHDLRRSHEWLA